MTIGWLQVVLIKNEEVLSSNISFERTHPNISPSLTFLSDQVSSSQCYVHDMRSLYNYFAIINEKTKKREKNLFINFFPVTRNLFLEPEWVFNPLNVTPMSDLSIGDNDKNNI